MKKTIETLLALLLSTVLILSALPTALAADNGPVSRAIALQMLYNHAGRPKIETGTQSPFPDAAEGKWHFNAACWGAAQGIVSGYGDGRLGYADPVTIQQMAVMLYKYSGSPAAQAELSGVGTYDDWAADALRWAVSADLFQNVAFANAAEEATIAQTTQMMTNLLHSPGENKEENTVILTDENSVALRVGTYNIGAGAGDATAKNMELIAQDILSKDLDLVGLQEVDRNCSRTKYADMAALLSQHTGYNYYYVKCVDLWGKEAKDGQYGDCILSKYPLKVAETTMLEHGTREPRSLAHVVVNVEGTDVHFYNTHLESGTKDSNQNLRLTQLGQIAQVLQRGPEQYILVGDFNTTPEYQYYMLPFLSGMCKEKGNPVTFPKSGNTIDNILVPDGVQIVSSGVLESGNSDHHMLFAEVRIKK